MNGHVDPTLFAESERQRELLDAVRARAGHRLDRIPGSDAVWLTAPGIDLKAASLRHLSLLDLKPQDRR